MHELSARFYPAISTHTLTWSVTSMCISKFAQRDFNSHAHVERDSRRNQSAAYGLISTHTLTWSVTDYDGNFYFDDTDFNSHAHVERD